MTALEGCVLSGMTALEGCALSGMTALEGRALSGMTELEGRALSGVTHLQLPETILADLIPAYGRWGCSSRQPESRASGRSYE